MVKCITLGEMQQQKWGSLTVIDGPFTNKKHNKFLCLCECGERSFVQGIHLRSGHTTSCGCQRKIVTANRSFKNLKSQRFGRLVILHKVDEIINKNGRILWLCQCDCGKETQVRSNGLLSGDTRSCGCLHSETSAKNLITGGSKLRKKENHPNWNPKITQTEREDLRRRIEGYKEWCYSIKNNANFTCDICKNRGGKLRSHHLYSYHSHPHLRTEISNGVCLCMDCHNLFHKTCGRKNNTPEQYYEFKSIRNSTPP